MCDGGRAVQWEADAMGEAWRACGVRMLSGCRAIDGGRPCASGAPFALDRRTVCQLRGPRTHVRDRELQARVQPWR